MYWKYISNKITGLTYLKNCGCNESGWKEMHFKANSNNPIYQGFAKGKLIFITSTGIYILDNVYE